MIIDLNFIGDLAMGVKQASLSMVRSKSAKFCCAVPKCGKAGYSPLFEAKCVDITAI
jgi:hypothetical protein